MNNLAEKLWMLIETIVRAVFGLFFRICHIEFTEEQWESLLQFVKFGIVGAWNTVFSYAINVGCLLIFEKLGILSTADLDMYVANTIAFIMSVLCSFLLNSRFVFTLEEGQSRNFWKALLKSYLSYGFTGIILNNILAYVWVRVFGISKFVAPLISMVIAIPINFFMNKLWAFKTENVDQKSFSNEERYGKIDSNERMTGRNNMGISVVLLAYKEEENLKVLLPQIVDNVKKTGEDYEILVIDTAEPLDDTKGVCETFGARYINQEEPAFGGAFKTGIKYAEMDKFLILDSDGSHNPKYIPSIYEKFTKEDCDVVIGSRYVEGGKTNDARSSIIMSHILNGMFRFFLGIKAKDISTDYRMYRTGQLKQVKLTCRNYDVLQEVLLRLRLNKADKKLKIGEVPIEFDKRIYGESKRRLIPFILSYMKTLCKLTITRIFG